MTIKRAKFNAPHERCKYWLLSWVSIANELVVLLSFGYLTADWRAHLLFSKWMDN